MKLSHISAKKIVFTCVAVLVFVSAAHLVIGATTAATAPDPELAKQIKSLDASLRNKRAQLDAIKKQQNEYKAKLTQIQNESATLKSQLEAVDLHASQTQLELDQARIDIETINLEIQKVTLEIADQDKKIETSKTNLTSALKLLSQEDGKSQLEIILMNDYLTDYVNQLKYLENINDKISDTLGGLRLAKDNLTKSRSDLDASRERLRVLRSELEQKQVALAEEKDAKSYLLDKTKMSEAEYAKMLAESRHEQESANADIVSAERRLREKLRQQNGANTPIPSTGFIWPIPSHRVTAYFHDPSYPFRAVFDHPAIDIGTPQGTPIRAAASGYVIRARDGGMGYSYISIAHAGGISTVYGHVSKIYVSDNDLVEQGQIIGLSGAMPGTPGAGPFTTGPHLHLEFRVNGIPDDPLNYLPK